MELGDACELLKIPFLIGETGNVLPGYYRELSQGMGILSNQYNGMG
jgi:hypothetical protein